MERQVKKFYFVGGPRAGKSEEFFQRLAQVGGTPATWRIYPHVGDDGKALHIAEVKSVDEIWTHLRHFDGIYEVSDIVEIVETPKSA